MYKVAVVDLSFEYSRYQGGDFFNESKRKYPQVPVIIISGYNFRAPWADASVDKGNLEGVVKLVKSYLSKDKKPF